MIYPYKLRIKKHTSDNDNNDDVRANLPDGVEDAYIFGIEGSNINLDSYFTHMTRKTLKNFARDAAAGVQFLDSHNNRNLGYGRSYGGRVRIDKDREPVFDAQNGVEMAIAAPSQYAYFQGDVYTVPGINFGGGLTYASTDDFIRALETGLAADVSVGFGGGEWRCDICGNNYLSYHECQHFAGQVYGIGDAGDRQVLSTVSIDGARLREVSAVYDGATPNATILKARAAAEDGKLGKDDKRFLEVRYQVDIPTGRIYPAVKTTGHMAGNTTEEILMKDKNEHVATLDALREILAETNADETAELTDQVRELVGELKRLRPLADDGRQYRADLIADALKEGVRAIPDFNQESYRSLLEQSKLDAIKQMRADWAAVANKRWPNGRQTTEANNEPGDEATPVGIIPDEAYAA